MSDLDFWKASLAGEKPAITEEPQAGYYRRRLVKGGPFVPVRIWHEGARDENGDLIEDERTLCSVDGRLVDAADHWTYCADNPVTESEFEYLTRVSNYAKARDPREPLASPRKKINPLSFPIPKFEKAKK